MRARQKANSYQYRRVNQTGTREQTHFGRILDDVINLLFSVWE
jgi:hypothetical protein